MKNDKNIFTPLGASNHSKGVREEHDFYATSPLAIHKLLDHESFSNAIWEPACGLGHLSEVLKLRGYNVYSSDLFYRGYSNQNSICDFLKQNYSLIADCDIITNPPYKNVTEFILKALDLVTTGHKVAMFLKLLTLEGQKRYEQIFSKQPPKTIYVFIKRVLCGKNGNFEGQSAICYAWFVWEKGFKGDPIIKWI